MAKGEGAAATGGGGGARLGLGVPAAPLGEPMSE